MARITRNGSQHHVKLLSMNCSIGMQHSEKGFVFLWALFAAALAGIMLAGTGQVWQVTSQREKEKELLFVGDQFRRAIISYYNDPSGGAKQYPESLEQLLEDKRSPNTKRHLRKIFIDPMTNTTDWGLVDEPVSEQEANSSFGSVGKKGIIGVYSRSKGMPMKIGNFKDHYEEFSDAVTYQDWKFVFAQDAAGASSAQQNPQSGASQSNSPFASQSSSKSGTPSPGASAQPPSQTNQSPFR